jgi:hypothetical protein
MISDNGLQMSRIVRLQGLGMDGSWKEVLFIYNIRVSNEYKKVLKTIV